MSTFSTDTLVEKLSRLSLSQDSIETLSLWVIEHKANAETAVQTWLQEVKKGSADRRLVLFYLANDILQNGRRRGADIFLDLFQDPLRQAVTMIGGQKIQTSIERMFRIWKERRLYNNAFLKELEMLIEPVRKPQVNEPIPDFKLPLLQDALSEFAKFEAELKVKTSHLSNLRVDISNPTASLSMLKDKSAGGRVSSEFEEASQKLQDYCECLGIEVNERINILDMLKECKTCAAYRLSELHKTAADYKNLSVSVQELKSKVEQRLKDLERAHSTATSDPSAKDDITDIGDMEIESDGENQDSQESGSNPHTAAPKPPMVTPPGMIMAPPVASFPAQQPNVGSGYTKSPGIFQTQFTRPPGQFQRAPNRPPQTIGGMFAQRPLPPRNRFPPHFQGRGFQPPTRMTHLVRGQPPAYINGPHTISGFPVLYKRPDNSTVKTNGDGVGVSVGTKPSLDERLKDLVLKKKFGDSVLNEDTDVNSEEKPYSPSAEESLVINSEPTEEVEDKESLATPTDSPNEEASPTPNMDNPILQALYESQASPESEPSGTSKSLVPDYNNMQDNDELSTSDLKNILDKVKSGNKDDTVNNVTSSSSDVSPSAGVNPNVGGNSIRTTKLSLPTEINITPTLTNLLDEIFPQLTKSLIDRKRKKEPENESSTKVPCLANTHQPRPPQPRLPHPTQRPMFIPRPPGGPRPTQLSYEGPRPPFDKARVPPPRMMYSPVHPHPNQPYLRESLRPLDKQVMENRYGSGNRNFSVVGIRPRVMSYPNRGAMFRPPPYPGYRPLRPRYV